MTWRIKDIARKKMRTKKEPSAEVATLYHCGGVRVKYYFERILRFFEDFLLN